MNAFPLTAAEIQSLIIRGVMARVAPSAVDPKLAAGRKYRPTLSARQPICLAGRLRHEYDAVGRCRLCGKSAAGKALDQLLWRRRMATK